MALTKVTKHVIDFNTGISYESDIKTSSFVAEANKGYKVNTTSGGVTVTLPATSTEGDTITITDYAGKFGVNACTVTSTANIQGVADDFLFESKRGSGTFVYLDSTQGWMLQHAANVKAKDPLTVDFLVIAGGGGGGSGFGGGGGAGGYRTSYGTSGGGTNAENAFTLETGTAYNVTVGNGGAGGVSTASNLTTGGQGANGEDSIFHTITSKGGGGGGSYYPSGGGSTLNNGADGGSGGGAGSDEQSSVNTGGNALTNPIIHGYDAADGAGRTPYAGTGGGGAGGAGQGINSNSISLGGGDGGVGLTSSITGTSVARAGGGGGGAYTYQGSNYGNAGAGQAGGGNGTGAQNGVGEDGDPNTGSGGGGGGYPAPCSGGAGGSGVVILRFPEAYSATATSGLVSTQGQTGASKYITITAGTGTVTFT